jgi:hypothetical protein
MLFVKAFAISGGQNKVTAKVNPSAKTSGGGQNKITAKAGSLKAPK